LINPKGLYKSITIKTLIYNQKLIKRSFLLSVIFQSKLYKIDKVRFILCNYLSEEIACFVFNKYNFADLVSIVCVIKMAKKLKKFERFDQVAMICPKSGIVKYGLVLETNVKKSESESTEKKRLAKSLKIWWHPEGPEEIVLCKKVIVSINN